MEIVFAVAVMCLAAGGLALGVVFGRGPAKTSCAAADSVEAARCADCPLRKRRAEEGA